VYSVVETLDSIKRLLSFKRASFAPPAPPAPAQTAAQGICHGKIVSAPINGKYLSITKRAALTALFDTHAN